MVDVVVGPQTYHRLPEILNRLSNKSRKIIDTDFPIENKFDELKKIRTNKNPVAFLSIQEGCDKFCSFCVVPYTRGAEYSRPRVLCPPCIRNHTKTTKFITSFLNT